MLVNAFEFVPDGWQCCQILGVSGRPLEEQPRLLGGIGTSPLMHYPLLCLSWVFQWASTASHVKWAAVGEKPVGSECVEIRFIAV